ncbi:unnamed protein product, partial [Choristocarpus tenellus]
MFRALILWITTIGVAQGFVPSASSPGNNLGVNSAPTRVALTSSTRQPPTRPLRTFVDSSASVSSSFLDLIKGFMGGAGSRDTKEGLENNLLEAIEEVEGRGKGVTQEQQAVVDSAVAALEADGGVPDPASSPLVDGVWRLIFTTTPGTASPVQRSFVGVDGFAIYQNIDIYSQVSAEGSLPTVTNVVDFGKNVGQLRVTALASTEAKPLEDFVPRRGDGRFFGLNVLGVSKVTPPENPKARIDFQFDEAGFELKILPFTIPYPVPFRLLGDDVKGWIDLTYLSNQLRLARGNKGTLFVLQRIPPPRP